MHLITIGSEFKLAWHLTKVSQVMQKLTILSQTSRKHSWLGNSRASLYQLAFINPWKSGTRLPHSCVISHSHAQNCSYYQSNAKRKMTSTFQISTKQSKPKSALPARDQERLSARNHDNESYSPNTHSILQHKVCTAYTIAMKVTLSQRSTVT